MTPKEKATELVRKFIPFVENEEGSWYDRYYDEKVEAENAKQCALIAVDEIIGQAECNRCYDFDKEYYEQVKSEIEKL